jgi:hypothetical protein
MSLSDCSKCWDTPCTCGYEWEKYSLEYLLKFRTMINGVIDNKQLHNTEKKCVRCGRSFNDQYNILCLDCNGDDDATG